MQSKTVRPAVSVESRREGVSDLKRQSGRLILRRNFNNNPAFVTMGKRCVCGGERPVIFVLRSDKAWVADSLFNNE